MNSPIWFLQKIMEQDFFFFSEKSETKQKWNAKKIYNSTTTLQKINFKFYIPPLDPKMFWLYLILIIFSQ